MASDGTWKLGNFEFLCSLRELNSNFLHETRPRRYGPAIPPEETISVPTAVDTFAFGRLVQEVLKEKESPGIKYNINIIFFHCIFRF